MKIIPDYILESWRSQTEANRHTEVRTAISEYFGLTELEKLFQTIQARQDDLRYLEPHLYTIRTYATKILLSKIRTQYGPEVYNEVYKSL